MAAAAAGRQTVAVAVEEPLSRGANWHPVLRCCPGGTQRHLWRQGWVLRQTAYQHCCRSQKQREQEQVERWLAMQAVVWTAW